MAVILKRWLLHRLGLRWSYVLMPPGGRLEGPCRIEGYNLKFIGGLSSADKEELV